jgi:hypothetical protein
MKYRGFVIPLFGLLGLLSPAIVSARQGGPPGRPDMTFGGVTTETFAPMAYGIDSAANAVILFDRGEVNFDPSYNSQGFSIVFERHTRIRLLHKSAFGLATFTLSTSRKGGSNPILQNFKGATYNLEDGKVVNTKLDKSNIFKDQSGNFNLEKVVFPNVREGSVIEYTFRVVYPGFQYIPAWKFQGQYPELWSEYDIIVPQLYDYAVRHQGYQKYIVDSSIYSSASFPVSFSQMGGSLFRGTWSGRTIRRIWALQDVPALEKAEPYTTTLKNHLSKIEFQLSGVHTNGYDRTFRTTWNELTEELLKRPDFGAPLSDRNHWLDDELKSITAGGAAFAGTASAEAAPAGAASPEAASLGALRKIFAYVRDHFDCSNADGLSMSQPLKKTWEDKKGNVADINLLLTALCRHQGLEASPVILSTRTNGYAVEDYPLLSDYNYVIVRVRMDGKDYLLDASKPVTGFGQLPESCYNGWARAIDSSQAQIPLFPDSVTERRSTIVSLSNSDSGYTGRYTRTAGVFESMDLRNRLKQTKPEDFFESMRKSAADYRQLLGDGFDSLHVPEDLVSWYYEMKYNFTQGTIYFNPIFHERFNTNPFNSPVRHYPVEMPFCIDNMYVLTMEVPKGYKIDQLPKSQRVRLEDGNGFFEYLIQSDGSIITFRTRLNIKKTNYSVEEYAAIRDFFSFIVNKEKEPIVFKKIN